jgi:hypothetical protein
VPRAVLLCLLAGAAFPALAQSGPWPGMGDAGDGPLACLAAPPAGQSCVFYDDPTHHGCGRRGGPGCRKENGRCAAWRERVVPDCRVQAGGHGAPPPP